MCSSRWDTPIRSRGSCNDAARTQAPNETDRTPGMCSERTVSPFGKTVRRSAASAPMTASVTDGSLATRTIAATTAARTSTIAAAFTARSFTTAVPAVATGLRLRHAFGTRNQGLHRETQTAALIAVDQLDLHAVAFLHDVFGLLGALVAHLGDVH